MTSFYSYQIKINGNIVQTGSEIFIKNSFGYAAKTISIKNACKLRLSFSYAGSS